MEQEAFEKKYKLVAKEYPAEVMESVKRCYKPFELRPTVFKESNEYHMITLSQAREDLRDRFFEGLTGSDYSEIMTATFTHPRELTKAERQYRSAVPYAKTPKGHYDGQLFVVMNKATASSAENGLGTARQVPGTVFVGSPSRGCGTFGDCCMYSLPNSKIAFRFGYKILHYDDCEEGRGFLPDYWIDDEDPVRVVEEYLRLNKNSLSVSGTNHALI